MQFFVDLFISWFPLALLIGVYIWFMRKGFGNKQAAYMELHLAEMRRQNATLERIAAALDARSLSTPPSSPSVKTTPAEKSN